MELIGTLPEVSGLALYKQSHAGYDVGSTGADWKFGKTPKPGSLRFKKSMLTVGGKLGEKTHATMTAMVADADAVTCNEATNNNPLPYSDNIEIRYGNGKEYSVMSIAEK